MVGIYQVTSRESDNSQLARGIPFLSHSIRLATLAELFVSLKMYWDAIRQFARISLRKYLSRTNKYQVCRFARVYQMDILNGQTRRVSK